jgi:hypothetical protein
MGASTLADSIVHHEKLGTADLLNTLLLYLTGLTVSNDDERYQHYTLCKPALLRLHAEDPVGFLRVAKKIKERLGIPTGTIRQDIDLLAATQARAQQAQADPGVGGGSQATRLVALAADAELWHTPDDEAYATIVVEGHREHHPLTSKHFRRWLRGKFYRETRAAPGSQAVQDALGVLEAQAVFEGPEHSVFVRVAEHAGKIYIDLANPTWEAVEVSKNGWTVAANLPVKFRRPRGLKALPRPIRGGKLKRLRQFVNLADDDAWALLLAWLVMALCPHGPYPLLILHGGQGAAKSTLARVLKALIDANIAPLRAQPRDERDLLIAAENGWLLAFDNLSHLPQWLSDALCRLATGGGLGTRELYADREEVIFSALRAVILTGITELATRSDLLDRAIILYLTDISEDERKEEKEFWNEFAQAAPQILGALLTAVCTALRRVEKVKLPRLPRMADFARWATAAEPALGLEPGAFMAAYAENRQTGHSLALEASPIATSVQKLLEDVNTWQGTARQLLVRLADSVTELVRRDRGWPKNERSLSQELRRLVPNLRAVGVGVRFWRAEDKARTRFITISRALTDKQQDQPGKRTQTPNDADAGGKFTSAKKPSKIQGADATDATDAKFRPQSNGAAEGISPQRDTLGNAPDAPDVSGQALSPDRTEKSTPCSKPGREQAAEHLPPPPERPGNFASAASVASTLAISQAKLADANQDPASADAQVASAAGDPDADRVAADERAAIQEELSLLDEDVVFETEGEDGV